MERRLVWIERVWMVGKAALVRGDHWAVRVGEYGIDCYEVQQEKKTLSIKSTNEMDTGFLMRGEELERMEVMLESYALTRKARLHGQFVEL